MDFFHTDLLSNISNPKKKDKYVNNIKKFLSDETGNAIIDYCMLSTIVSAAMIGPLKLVGQRLSIVFLTIANALAIH